MTGTASMPARLKATAEACKNAFLRDQTYPDAFQFADVRRYRFNQTNSRDFAKQLGDVTEPKDDQDVIRFAQRYARIPVLTVDLPFTSQPFGGEQRPGNLRCQFSASIGGEGALTLLGYPQSS